MSSFSHLFRDWNEVQLKLETGAPRDKPSFGLLGWLKLEARNSE